MLSPVMLERLRTWWRVARAQGKMLDGGWLFPGLNPVEPGDGSTDHASHRPTFVCRHCGAPMLVIETFARAQHIRAPPIPSRLP